jgi:hypothetical protein
MPVIPDTWDAEAGGSQVQGLPVLNSKSEASLGNLARPWLKILKCAGTTAQW